MLAAVEPVNTDIRARPLIGHATRDRSADFASALAVEDARPATVTDVKAVPAASRCRCTGCSSAYVVVSTTGWSPSAGQASPVTARAGRPSPDVSAPTPTDALAAAISESTRRLVEQWFSALADPLTAHAQID